MPCRDGGPSEDAFWAAERRSRDQLAQHLCGLCRRIESLLAKKVIDGLVVGDRDLTGLITDDEKLLTWWDKHKVEDEKRLAREKEKKRQRRIKRNALKKLTAEELEALGIK